MAAMQRFPTDYKGVFYRVGNRIGGQGTEKIFYVVFKKEGKVVEVKAGRQYADNMTPAKANRFRSDLIEGRRQTHVERREEERRSAQESQRTLAHLWKEYRSTLSKMTTLASDCSRFKYIGDELGHKMPAEIETKDIEKLKASLAKAGKSPQTIKHVIGLVRRIIRYGVSVGRCPMPSTQRLAFKMPKFDNQKTEYLKPDEEERLLNVLDEEPDQNMANLVRLAFVTGIRRTALLHLQWEDIDFERGFITLVEGYAKNEKAATIPLNSAARAVLENVERTRSPLIFPGKDGAPRVNPDRFLRKVREKAGLPSDFRMLHGLRHNFASKLANTGQVDLFSISKLLTHSSLQMTQRYAHLVDETLKRASEMIVASTQIEVHDE